MELWELVARESIRDCIARYNANGDSGRIDEMVEVFAPDGVMETGNGRYEGRDAIHAFMSSVVGAGPDRSRRDHERVDGADARPRSGSRAGGCRSSVTSPPRPRSTC